MKAPSAVVQSTAACNQLSLAAQLPYCTGNPKSPQGNGQQVKQQPLVQCIRLLPVFVINESTLLQRLQQKHPSEAAFSAATLLQHRVNCLRPLLNLLRGSRYCQHSVVSAESACKVSYRLTCQIRPAVCIADQRYTHPYVYTYTCIYI